MSSTEESLGRQPGKRALLRQMETPEQRPRGNGGNEGLSHTDAEEEQVDCENSRCKGQSGAPWKYSEVSGLECRE